MKINSNERELIEVNFWKNDEIENPESDSIINIINKISESAVFYDNLEKNKNLIKEKKTILEIGGGQGWASAILKKMYLDSNITLTDISEFAVKSKGKWEKIFDVTIDNAYACKSYSIPENSEKFDFVFCFAAAHHFTDLEASLKEIYRVLKKDGVCIFFHEPTCIKALYPIAYKRVNKKRPHVPEDVLIFNDVIKMAKQLGFMDKSERNTTTKMRGPFETVYYYFLSKSTILQKLLPCTANFIFVK